MKYLQLDPNNKILAVSNHPVFDNDIEVQDSYLDEFDPSNGEMFFNEGVITQTPITEEAVKVTQLSMVQARLSLLHFGKLADVISFIQSIPGPEGDVARIEWELRPTVERDHQLVTTIQTQFEWTNEFVDEMFQYGATL